MRKKSDRELMLRIIDSAYIDHCWKGAEKIYGKEATEKLRSVAPADPFLLRDMERFAETIKKVKRVYTNDKLKGFNAFTSDT